MKTSLRLALLASALASSAGAQLVTYNADLASPNIGAVSSSAANVSATAFALNNVTIGRVQVTGLDHAAVINPTVAQTSVNLGTTLSNATYFSITVAPSEGHELNLTSLTFEANAGGSSSPRGFAVFSSVGGFTVGDVLAQDDNGVDGTLPARPTQAPYSISLTSGVFQNLTAATEFRFYVQGQTFQSIDFDNIVLNGTVSAIPEPASAAALVGVAFLGFAGFRRR